jgi:hypothetical protein
VANTVALTKSGALSMETLGMAPGYASRRKKDQSPSFAFLTSQFYSVKMGCEAVVKMGPSGGKLKIEDGNSGDGETCLHLPQGALSTEVDITISEIDPEDSTIANGSGCSISERPMAVYKFEPEGLNFNKMATIDLLYSDSDQDGVVDGTEYDERAMSVMWWDGFQWRHVGDLIDEETNTVSAKIRHFSIYAVFPSAGLKDSDYRPARRIITPATVDTYNDMAHFGGIDASDVINIYDITGRRIIQLSGGTNTWDGRDEDGDIVESGIYIYQIKTEDKIISGTIVVAK